MTAHLKTLLPKRFESCPVCWRRIGVTEGVVPLFRAHSDGIGHACPMSGNPVS